MKWSQVAINFFSAAALVACNPPMMIGFGGQPLDRSADIRGPDADNNGIRDDIDAYIASLQVTNGQRKAIEQMARASQSMLLVDVNDPVALRAVSDKGSRAIVCLGAHFPDGKERSAIVTKIEGITANTRERAEQYFKYNQALSGGVYRLPSGNTCEALGAFK